MFKLLLFQGKKSRDIAHSSVFKDPGRFRSNKNIIKLDDDFGYIAL